MIWCTILIGNGERYNMDHNSFVYQRPPSDDDFIANIEKKIKERVDYLVNIRAEAGSPQHLATGKGIHPDAIAVISTVMFDSILAFHYHWNDPNLNEERRSREEIMKGYFGRYTVRIDEAPPYKIQYFNSIEKIKEAYPMWVSPLMFTIEEDEEE